MRSRDAEDYRLAFDSFVAAWTAIWLLAPRLAKCRPTLAVPVAVVVMLAIGVPAYLPEIVASFDYFGRLILAQSLVLYNILAVVLVLSMATSRLCCRKTYHPRRFLVLLLVWIFVGVLMGAALRMVWLYAYIVPDRSPPPALSILLRLIIGSLCLTGILYLVNLPFMCLALRSSFYRDRLHEILRLPQGEQRCL